MLTPETKVTLIATLTFGLEAVVKYEVKQLGFEKVKASDGKVEFEATVADIPKANLWLRSADRVLLKIGQFEALTFDELFEQTKAIAWEDWIPADAEFPVLGKAQKSQLGSFRACQSIVKKAVVDRLTNAYNQDWFPERGAKYTIQVAMYKDVATLTLDTTGSGLHKRGYRLHAGEAPLKETMASGLVQLSFWHPERRLIDPFCGSGTILIEAAMAGRNIAPGLNKQYDSEQWDVLPMKVWRDARQAAEDAIDTTERPPEFIMQGSDIDPEIIELAQINAERAGVGQDINFVTKDVHDLWIDRQYGIVITNPPYGQRMGGYEEINEMYVSFHHTFKKKWGWSVYVLTADKIFERYFKRARPDRVRKLFNGNLEVNYYQYYGDRPPKKEDSEK